MTCLTICQTAVRVFSPDELSSGIFAGISAFPQAISLSTHSESLWIRHGQFATLVPNNPMQSISSVCKKHISQRNTDMPPFLRVHQPNLLGQPQDTHLRQQHQKTFCNNAEDPSESFSAHLLSISGQDSAFYKFSHYAICIVAQSN